MMRVLGYVGFRALVLSFMAVLCVRTEDGAEPLQYPDFFIIGAMKCGTTTLHKLLTDNPKICGEGEKENRARRRTRENAVVSRRAAIDDQKPIVL